jgi:hypothetical protein
VSTFRYDLLAQTLMWGRGDELTPGESRAGEGAIVSNRNTKKSRITSNSTLLLALVIGSFLPSSAQTTFQIRSFDGTRKCLDYAIQSPYHVDAPVANQPSSPSSATVFLNDCANAHPIVIEELQNGRHEVVLHAGNKVIGIGQVTVIGGPVTNSPQAISSELPLELFNPNLTGISSASDHVFALDGDSIILASSRPCASTDQMLCPASPPQLVVQPQSARGANGTPLVVAPRTLADSEFWDFIATDNSGKDPTSGFVHVSTAAQLWNAICSDPAAIINPDGSEQVPTRPCSTFNSGWGTVIKVNPGVSVDSTLDLSAYPALILPAGVTLRGDRRGTNVGPQINANFYKARSSAFAECAFCMIEIHGDYVRVSGLRLRGQSRSTAKYENPIEGIEIDPPASSINDVASATSYISIVDHDDLSDWEDAAIEVNGGHSGDSANYCINVANDQARQGNVLITRNFIHDNEANDAGYGSVMSSGGRAVILGNTYEMNRHSIAGDGKAYDQYRAFYNFVLSSSPSYKTDQHEQDFDMHGTGDGGFGGIAGMVDIGGNTFLGNDRPNLEYRGAPCFGPYFHDNVTAQNQENAINLQGASSLSKVTQPPDSPTSPVAVSPYVPESEYCAIVANSSNCSLYSVHNRYANSSPSFVNPTNSFRVGDFDGDGVQDLFIATGTAWYFAPGGAADWRFLSAKTDPITALLFGDFDGDGRTDVLTKNGDKLMVSWGGVSDWEQLNPNPVSAPLTDLAVGNFVGDARDDIFWADGKTWQVSDHGADPFAHSQTSSFRVKDLRFGDFTGTGKTDVFAVEDGKWQVSYSASSSWTPLKKSLTGSVKNLVVADFDGDGKADIATSEDGKFLWIPIHIWMVSSNGATSWSHHFLVWNGSCDVESLAAAPAIGHFAPTDPKRKFSSADALVWNDKELCIVQPSNWSAKSWSRQTMR